MSDLASPWEILSELIAAKNSDELTKFIDNLNPPGGHKLPFPTRKNKIKGEVTMKSNSLSLFLGVIILTGFVVLSGCGQTDKQ